MKPLKPAMLKDRYWSTQYYINYLVRHTLESFWKNSLTNVERNLQNYPVRTHLEKTIGQTVKFFKSTNDNRGHPAIVAYSPFNEPHPAGFDNRLFERRFVSFPSRTQKLLVIQSGRYLEIITHISCGI
jgi:hypothetical protein